MLALHGLSSSSILGLRISLTSSKRLKYNKNLPGNRVRNSLAVGHVEEIGYCVRESCRVSLVKGEMRQPLVFCPLFFFPAYFYWEKGNCSALLCVSPLQSLCSLTGSVSAFPSPLIPLFSLQIKMCETCQNAEHNKSVTRKARPVRVESPWEVLGLDIQGE